MAVKNYSLADYDFTIKSIDTNDGAGDHFNFTLGGAGNFLGSVKVSWDNDIWQKESDVLGNVVFSKSYARDGQITISVNMMAEKVQVFNRIMQLYYGGSLTKRNTMDVRDVFFSIVIKKHNSTEPEITGSYCVLQKLPDIEYADTPGIRDFVFLAAELDSPNVKTLATDYSYRSNYNRD